MVSEISKWGPYAISTICLLFAFNAGAEEVQKKYDPRPFCRGNLNWVPHFMKEPFISFLNDVHCPTWMTKRFITKENYNTEIVLPRGLPFAFFCGVCYKPSMDQNKVSLSHTIGGNQAKLLTKTVNIKNHEGMLEHGKRNHQCQIVYGLTDYLEDWGELTCSASFGSRIMEETVTYSLADPDVLAKNETLIVPNLKQKVTLTCSGVQGEGSYRDPITYVWFHPMSGQVSMASPTTSRTATFQLHSEPLLVACATYHLLRNAVTSVTTFVVGSAEFIDASPEALANGVDFSDWKGSPSEATKTNHISYLPLACTLVGLYYCNYNKII